MDETNGQAVSQGAIRVPNDVLWADSGRIEVVLREFLRRSLGDHFARVMVELKKGGDA